MGARGPKRRPIKERLLEKRTIEEDCWLWTGSKSDMGYGRMGVGHTGTYFVHRLAYQEFKGPIPKGLYICHSCDKPLCFNPDHLWAGTQRDNLRDALAKGRCRNRVFYGEDHGQCKLTDKQILSMRNEYKLGHTSHRRLSAKFKVSRSHVARLLSCESRAFLKLP